MRRGDPRRHALYLCAYTGMDSIIRDPFAVTNLLYNVADMSGMRVIRHHVEHVKQELERLNLPNFEDEGGYSCLLTITTSHIALHAWPARLHFMFDLVSCRSFNKDAVWNMMIKEMNVTEIMEL